MSNTNNSIIAKNTVFLYFRMMVTMLTALYTSRIVLQALGVEDFGLYAVVGGVVSMFSFINNALSTSSSRFLTFELGSGNFKKLKKTFSTLLSLHIVIALIVVILAETIGLWFIYNKLEIPPDRMNAAIWVYHISVLTTVITITQVPYNATIISHEKMNVFAYVSIFDSVLKLGVSFLLKFSDYDRLILYALLISIVTIIIALYYRYYCVKNFKETQYQFVVDKDILKSIGVFSGWSLMGSATHSLNSHGTNIITNMFFGPAVVTARAISVQVDMAAMQFVQNFRQAVNPQIVKKFASSDYLGSKELLLNSTKFSFFLMLLLGLPIILLAEQILFLWLGRVPEYSVIFLQLIIIQSLFQVFDTSFLSALQAKGRLKENALISPIIGAIRFIVVYYMFRAGSSPVVLSYAGIISFSFVGLVIKPLLLIKIVNYNFKDIIDVFIPCFKVALTSIPLPFLLALHLDKGIISFILICIVSTICILISVLYLGIKKEMRYKIVELLKHKLKQYIFKF